MILATNRTMEWSMILNDIAPRNLPHRCVAKDQLNQGKSEVQKIQ